jgi:hypothetical protein
MTELEGPYFVQPPVMAVTVEDSMDIMIVRDTVRRAGNLLGFSPADRAQLASAAATLAELVLKSGDLQEITLNGVRQQQKNGLQISTPAPWLENVSSNNVLIALRSKLGDLVDEILVQGQTPPVIYLVMWLGDSRREAQEETD